jgi:hypothetical protein
MSWFWQFVTLILLLALIMTLVRPGSTAVSALTAVTNALADTISLAVHGTDEASGGGTS